MQDWIRAAAFRELSPQEIEFYIKRGRRLRSESAHTGTRWLVRKVFRGLRRLSAAWGSPLETRAPRRGAIERLGRSMTSID